MTSPVSITTPRVYCREVTDSSVSDQDIERDDRRYVPHRRHLSADALLAELTASGFHVQSLEGAESADVVCRLIP